MKIYEISKIGIIFSLTVKIYYCIQICHLWQLAHHQNSNLSFTKNFIFSVYKSCTHFTTILIAWSSSVGWNVESRCKTFWHSFNFQVSSTIIWGKLRSLIMPKRISLNSISQLTAVFCSLHNIFIGDDRRNRTWLTVDLRNAVNVQFSFEFVARRSSIYELLLMRHF